MRTGYHAAVAAASVIDRTRRFTMTRALLAALAVLLHGSPASTLEPIPDKLVVLTFDDSAKSHYTVARPILLKYKFGATFFITEGFDFRTNQKDYMTWEEIAQLHKDGFEIGNHTLDHQGVTAKTLAELPAQLRGISRVVAQYHRTVSCPGAGAGPYAA